MNGMFSSTRMGGNTVLLSFKTESEAKQTVAVLENIKGEADAHDESFSSLLRSCLEKPLLPLLESTMEPGKTREDRVFDVLAVLLERDFEAINSRVESMPDLAVRIVDEQFKALSLSEIANGQ